MVNEGSDCCSKTCVLSWAVFTMLLQCHSPRCDALVYKCLPGVQALQSFDVDILELYYITYMFLNCLHFRLVCHNCPMLRYVCECEGTCVRTIVFCLKVAIVLLVHA